MSMILRKGDRGEEVTAWRARVRELGHDPGADTGEFDEALDRATRAFQEARRLKVDGVVGPITRAAAQVHGLPAAWQRYAGARPEPRGFPRDTILAVRGIERMTEAFRAGLLELCDDLAIPVDSLAAIMSCESGGFNPAALNPLPAAGLIQLTLGARLGPDFDTKDEIRAVAKMSAEEQLERVVRPYYARIKASAGASPGHLYMLNFLPADAAKGDGFRLGIREDHPEAPQDERERRWRHQVYAKNTGFDRDRNGYFTIGEVYEVAASVCRGARGRRIRVDGSEV